MTSLLTGVPANVYLRPLHYWMDLQEGVDQQRDMHHRRLTLSPVCHRGAYQYTGWCVLTPIFSSF